MLELTRKSLVSLAHSGTEKQWLQDWHRRVKAGLEADTKIMKKKLREHRRMLRTGLGFMEENPTIFLKSIFGAWQRQVEYEKATGGQDHRRESTVAAPVKRPQSARARFPQDPSKESAADIEAKDYMMSSARLRFSRGLATVELDTNAAGVATTRAWRHWGQSGRLDRWKGTRAPAWLSAVREEIPKQLMSLKAAARGESKFSNKPKASAWDKSF